MSTRAFVNLLMGSAMRGFNLGALFLGVVVVALPAFANQQEKERMDSILSSRRIVPSNLDDSERATAAADTELLADGGFEVGSPPSGTSTFTTVSPAWTWQYTGSGGTTRPRYSNNSNNAAHTGDWCIYFDFGPSTNRLSQTVTIPSGVTATLSFWLKIGTFEPGSVAYDTLKVSVIDVSGSTPTSSLTYSNVDDNAGYTYVKRTLNVSAFAGKTVRVQFDLTADSTYNTIFLLDDVSLLTSGGSDPSALYVSDQPGDNRFKVNVQWSTAQGGGLSGTGNPISLTSLGIPRGGVFWFFSADNPEVMVKVLNGCGANGSFWVFYVAGTNVGMTTTVTDTKTGRVKTYHNPDLTQAAPVQDTNAFPCP